MKEKLKKKTSKAQEALIQIVELEPEEYFDVVEVQSPNVAFQDQFSSGNTAADGDAMEVLVDYVESTVEVVNGGDEADACGCC